MMAFGADLPDQIESVNEYVSESLKLFGDVRDYVKERVALEIEYAERLEKLGNTTAKRLKKFPSLFYGPSAKSILKKELTSPEEWQQEDVSSFMHAWLSFLHDASCHAKRRSQLASQWTETVVDPMKVTYTQADEMRKKHLSYAEKLRSDVAKSYVELEKYRQRFEESQKKASAQLTSYERVVTEDRASEKEKLRKSSEQAEAERVQLHNDYVLFTLYTNSVKNDYYTTSMPSVLDDFQQLSESSYQNMTSLLATFAQHEQDAARDVLGLVDHRRTQFLSHVSIANDTNLFIKHHRSPSFVPPADSCYQYHSGQAKIPASEAPLLLTAGANVVLVNVVSKLTQRIEELNKSMAICHKEAEGVTTLLNAYTKQPGLGSVHDVARQLFDIRHQLSGFNSEHLALSSQLAHIKGVLNEHGLLDEDASVKHSFKPTAFALPKACDVCQASLWGSSRHGLTCTTCGFNCHSKCELKVPPDCRPKEKTPVKKHTASVSQGAFSTETMAVALYDYAGENRDELSLRQGDVVALLGHEESGWQKARHTSNHKEGWIPMTYVEIKKGNAMTKTPRRRQAKAMYDYVSQSNDELSMRAGDVVDVVEEDPGNGWCQASIKGNIGRIPANYIQ